MFRNFIMKGLLILHVMNAAVSGDEYMKEEAKKNIQHYIFALDCSSVDEFTDMNYYLFCSTQWANDVGPTEYEQTILNSQTQTIEEAKELYQDFKNQLPLEIEEEEEGEETNIFYVSSDCKWIITCKWSKFETISTQMLFYDKEEVRKKTVETSNGIYPILIVKDGEAYDEIEEEYYRKLSEIRGIGFYNGGYYDSLKRINAKGDLSVEINADYSLLTIKKIEDETVLWSFSLRGIQEEAKKTQDNEENDESLFMYGDICQFEGNEKEGWLVVQAGPSSFFRISYPSGEVTYLGEYMYSMCFSLDGKYAAYSSIDYDNACSMSWEEQKRIPPGIYILEIETGKTAYFYRNRLPEERFFMWLEKESFEEFMGDTDGHD